MMRISGCQLCLIALFVGSVAALVQSPIAIAQSARLKLSTNQAYIENLQSPAPLQLADKRKMFSIVLANLPPRVKVYPTENYFYFSFHANGVPYAGNIRLDASNRDKGKVNFAYFRALKEWSGNESIHYLLLDRSHGVKVERISDLVYRVSDGGASVVFELNDLRHVKPPKGMLLKDERYIGPVFDESGIRFFLIYNHDAKVFHYILDETVKAADLLEKSSFTDRILIGRRTGFAYYRDYRFDRKILIGIFMANARVNNYFDGPFDQLPDNFIEEESLRSAILEVTPSLKGRIDRFGGSFDGEERYMIAPYIHFDEEDNLRYFHNCTQHPNVTPKLYPHCFVYLESDTDQRHAPVYPEPSLRSSKDDKLRPRQKIKRR